MWEAVPLALKKANTINKFKKLYKAHLISCQSANICFVYVKYVTKLLFLLAAVAAAVCLFVCLFLVSFC